jgi:hypothetical protein
MRELKIESPLPPLPQITPIAAEIGGKKSRTARLAKDSAPASQAQGVGQQERSAEAAISLPVDTVTETPKKRQRQTSAKAKSTAKAKNAPVTDLAKSHLDVSKQLILDRFRQLEQECTQIKTQAAELNQQSTAIQAQMEYLRNIAQQATPASPTSTYRAQPTGLRDIVTSANKVQAPDTIPDTANRQRFQPSLQSAIATSQLQIQGSSPDAIRPPTGPPVGPPPRSPQVPPVSSQLATPAISHKLLAIAHAAYDANPTSSTTRSRERNQPQPLRRRVRWPAWPAGRDLINRWLQTMPEQRGAIAIDALATVFSAIVIRWGLQALVNTWPILSGLFSLVILLPAAVAIYLALFKPKANSVVIYRLLLITLGLLLGGKL